MGALLALGAATSFLIITLDDVPRGAYLPRVEEHLSRATIYSQAVAEIALCGPSRAAFLTGQSSRRTGLSSNEPADWGTGFVPQALQAAGYRTQIIGKMPNGFLGSPADLGFDRWAVLVDLAGQDRYFDATLDVNGTLKEGVGYTSDDLYRRGQNCVEGSKPFFCWIAALGAHAPASAAPRYVGGCAGRSFLPGPAFNEADMSDKHPSLRDLEIKPDKVEKNWRDQCETLLADDEGIAEILEGVGTDVCVILTADNGKLSGQHRVTGKSHLYEESIGVPLFTWNCGTAAGVDHRLVSNLDIPAHILSLAAVEALRPLDGRPLDGTPRNCMRIYGGTDVPAEGRRCLEHVNWTWEDGFEEKYDLVEDPFQLDGR